MNKYNGLNKKIKQNESKNTNQNRDYNSILFYHQNFNQYLITKTNIMDRVTNEQMMNCKPIEFETVVYYLRKATNSRREDKISVDDYNKAMINRFDNAGFVYFKQEIKVLKR